MTGTLRPVGGLVMAVMAVALGGCAALGLDQALGLAAAGAQAPLSQMPEQAIARAEKAVASRPGDASVRAALGRAYLAAGRFASAVDALDDALALGDEAAATILGLALSETALGNKAEAVQLLDDWGDTLPAADRGLSLALAGETRRGVEVLAEALRAGDTRPRLRQNLAFAYALDGRWREARLMAAQDLGPRELDARIAAWARMGRPDAAGQRVAHLLNAPLRADPGYPQALALVRPEAEAGKADLAIAPVPAAAP